MNKPILKFVKVKDVKTPQYAEGGGNAGIDFFIPNTFVEQTVFANDDVLISSGIKMNIPKDHVLIAFNKSGVATKKKLDIGACVVDESYSGELHIHLFNTSANDVILSPGDKIAQFVLLPVSYAKIIECQTEDECFAFTKSVRGDKGFGSTGSK